MKNTFKYSFGLLAFLLALLVITTSIDQFFPEDQFIEQNVLKIDGVTIILGRDCKAIVADTTAERADSIRLGLDGQIFIRPTTHDVFAQTLKTFNITLEKITFDNYDGELYYASLYLSTPEKKLRLDTKPSDAIAVALRMDAPILLNKTLLNKIGKDIC